jgi:hypothetical protein
MGKEHRIILSRKFDPLKNSSAVHGGDFNQMRRGVKNFRIFSNVSIQFLTVQVDFDKIIDVETAELCF